MKTAKTKLKVEDKWHNVKDLLPYRKIRYGTNLMIHVPVLAINFDTEFNFPELVWFNCITGKFYYPDNFKKPLHITHWRQLPEVPKCIKK